MGRPKAVSTGGFEEVRDRIFGVVGCSNSAQLARFIEIAPSAVTRPFKDSRIPDGWFPLIASKAKTTESYLRYGLPIPEKVSESLVDLNLSKSYNNSIQKKSYDGDNIMDSEKDIIISTLAKEVLALKEEILFLKERKGRNTKGQTTHKATR